MTRICKICKQPFEPKNSRDRSLHCSPECRKIAARASYLKWKTNHPERFKEFRQPHYKNKTRDERVKNAYRGTPQPKIKRYCIYWLKDEGRKCGRVTGRGGTNYFYCDYHWQMLSNDIASDQYAFMDGGENLVNRFEEAVR